ncbi:hypothetical protein Bca101_035018 [Brassica carinata]
MDAQRALLDELMGAARNLTDEERRGFKEIKWDDREVCAFYMVRFCPHDLFVNTKSDLGACLRIHDPKLKERCWNRGGGSALLKNVERMESDIIAGCFCNAAQVIGMKCLVTAVEVREASVREAAMHLGRTEKILEIVDRRCMPALSHHEVAKIDELLRFERLKSLEDISPPLPEAIKDGGVIVTESSTPIAEAAADGFSSMSVAFDIITFKATLHIVSCF